MKIIINRILKLFNYKISRIEPRDKNAYFLNNLNEELKARQIFLKYFGVNVLLDVGANTGQYASLMRRIGYKGKIVSFEPLSSAFNELKRNLYTDNNWIAENFALGSKEEESIIHVSGNSYSSSLLDILPSHIEFDTNSQYIAEEKISIKRLDDIFSNYCSDSDVVMLKIDTQGFEKMVLDGALESLKSIKFLQLEISIEPLYQYEILFVEMINFLEGVGFSLFALENGIRNPNSGKLLQVDGIFVRNI
jgi:FkbM family methyltransferase